MTPKDDQRAQAIVDQIAITDAVGDAFKAHVGKLFSVLCDNMLTRPVPGTGDPTAEQAVAAFTRGMRLAMAARKEALRVAEVVAPCP